MTQGLLPCYTSRFDLVDGYYWWLVDHHTGQWSERYARMSKMQQYYRPSRLAHGPESEEAQAIYDALCDKAQCAHERGPLF